VERHLHLALPGLGDDSSHEIERGFHASPLT
jgi:hypothetical protein